MKYSSLRVVSTWVLASACWCGAANASTVLVSVADSISGSVEAVSDSVSRVSKSSSNAVRNVAEGDYRVIEVAAADGQPGKMCVTLQALATPQQPAMYLYVPRADFNRAELQGGQVVTASKRPYGMAFSKQQAAVPFAVVLADDWLKELPAHAVAG